MKRLRLWVLPAVMAAALLLPGAAQAATIRILTGVDASNTPLGQNVADPYWNISVQGGASTSAEVVNTEVICCGMESAGAQAAWISDSSVTAGSISTGWGIGPTAVATRTFNMTGLDPASASFAGIWRVADFRQGIYLNGNLIDPATANGAIAWDTDQAFNLVAGSGFFLPGINTLELRGTSGNSVWDGFWLDGTVTARAVPEPASLSLLALGLAGLAARRRKMV